MPHRQVSFLSSLFLLFRRGQLDGVFGGPLSLGQAVYLIRCGRSQHLWFNITYVLSCAACVR